MALFGKKKQNVVGIDFSGSSVKAVELHSEGGRPQLVTYGFVEQSTDVVKSDAAASQSQAVQLISEVVKKARIMTKRVVAALPSFSVFSSIISLPEMSKKDLMSAVRWEAKKFVPMPLEEMILDWEIVPEQLQTAKEGGDTLNQAQAGKKNIRVLLTAAPKALVERYVSIFKSAELQLVGLETESFALERALVGNDPSPVMVVDIGSRVTSIMIYKNSIPMLTRSIDVGGESMTETIMRTLNVDAQRAEQFKRDFGLSMGTSGTEKIPKTIEFVTSSIINEIRYVLNIFRSQSDKPLEKIILTGGSAFLVNLPQYLNSIFQVKVFVGDPWARISYPIDLRSVLQELGPRLSVAIGLAMRDIV
ncbi:MAG: type IV pilus assembly protein PilM [Patescibacteria group bacterium]|jgi:type IV pilus assembly protein PilM